MAEGDGDGPAEDSALNYAETEVKVRLPGSSSPADFEATTTPYKPSSSPSDFVEETEPLHSPVGLAIPFPLDEPEEELSSHPVVSPTQVMDMPRARPRSAGRVVALAIVIAALVSFVAAWWLTRWLAG